MSNITELTIALNKEVQLLKECSFTEDFEGLLLQLDAIKSVSAKLREEAEVEAMCNNQDYAKWSDDLDAYYYGSK